MFSILSIYFDLSSFLVFEQCEKGKQYVPEIQDRSRDKYLAVRLSVEYFSHVALATSSVHNFWTKSGLLQTDFNFLNSYRCRGLWDRFQDTQTYQGQEVNSQMLLPPALPHQKTHDQLLIQLHRPQTRFLYSQIYSLASQNELSLSIKSVKKANFW